MKPIAAELTFHGHHLRQIWRKEHVAIYERSLSKDKSPHELELIVIQIAPEKQFPKGSVVPEHEAYPSSSQWGQYGWSFPIKVKPFVLDLAEKLSAIKGSYRSFVHQAIDEFKAKNR